MKALLLEKIYTIRSHRQLCEQIRYNFLYRWFLDLNPEESVWDASTFSQNAERLQELAKNFLEKNIAKADSLNLLSHEHFSVDGTLLEAAAGLKSLEPITPDAKPLKSDKDDNPGNPSVDFRGKTLCNETYRSKTDPQARLYRKGKGYDTQACINTLRQLGVTPHVDMKVSGGSGKIDGRTYCQAGYAISLKKRKTIEETFGWDKVIGGMRKLRHRGLHKVSMQMTLSSIAQNLVRMGKRCAAVILQNRQQQRLQTA